MCHDVYDLQTHDCRHPYCWPHVVCKYKSITNVSVEIFADGKIEFAGSDKQKKEMIRKSAPDFKFQDNDEEIPINLQSTRDSDGG